MTADWSVPVRTQAGLVKWAIDRDPRDDETGVRIYAVPDVGNIRCVAKDVHAEDAELIVRLYDQYREASV